MGSLFPSNNFDPNKDIPDLSGRVYIVTGGSAGIGFGIVAYLLQNNASKIYVLSEKESHAISSIEELKKFGDTSRVEFLRCDLKSLRHTLQVAEQLRKLDRIDALICNAGEGVGIHNESADDLDTHFQVNHLSQMLLSMVVLPVLQKTKEARLVWQSSELHRYATPSTKFESLHEINQDVGPIYLYNRSKLAQILFVRELTRRLRETARGKETVYVNATHPGGVQTDQQKQAEEAYGALGRIGVAAVKPLLKDPVDQGCRPALWVATSDDIIRGNVQGQYIVPDKKPTEPSSQAKDEALAAQLWEFSEDILKQKLGSLPYESSTEGQNVT